MNGSGGPPSSQGSGNDNGRPIYHAAHQDMVDREQSGQGVDGARRYVPPQLRLGQEIIRPESSISNVSAQTFASQMPFSEGNYSYGPTQLTHNMAAYNTRVRTQQQPYAARAITRPGFGVTNGTNGVNGNLITTAPASNSSNITITPYTHARRDSGAPQLRSAFLAQQVMQGRADNPYDPDYGNPGPSRRPPPPPAPIAFPSPAAAVNGRSRGAKKATRDDTDGNVKAFLGSAKVELPSWFAAAQAGNPPSLEEAFASLPFVEASRYATQSTAGVVKIVGIPYATTRAEVNAFLGRNTQICFQPKGTGFHAVHIMMDRHSGKTLDAFVEVSTPTEAVWVVNQFQKRVVEKRPGKIGMRTVEVELSSQEDLMANMFSRAKNTTWEAGGYVKIDPTVEEVYPGVFLTGFIGFLQDEEIVHMQKHAEVPQRSPFATRCMIRTYECLIATIYKYPWFDHEHVLLKERDALFECAHACVRAMIALLRKTHNDKADHSKPTINTLTELCTAIFVCPGFADAQKAAVVMTLRKSGFGKVADDRALNLRFGGTSEDAAANPFKALVLKPGVSKDVLDYFAILLTDATSSVQSLSLADLHAMSASNANGNIVNKNFGDLQVDYKNCKSLADAGRAELRYLESVLGRVLVRRGSSRAGTGTGTGSGSGADSRVGSQGSSLMLPS